MILWYRTKVCPENRYPYWLVFFLFLDKPRSYTSRTYFQVYFKTLFKLILRPLLGLSWNTDLCWTDELRLGCFSIRPKKVVYLFLLCPWLVIPAVKFLQYFHRFYLWIFIKNAFKEKPSNYILFGPLQKVIQSKLFLTIYLIEFMLWKELAGCIALFSFRKGALEI